MTHKGITSTCMLILVGLCYHEMARFIYITLYVATGVLQNIKQYRYMVRSALSP